MIRLLGLFVALVFVCGQAMASVHTHEHAEEHPTHEFCEFCILAVNNDGECNIDADQSLDADSPAIWRVLNDCLALSVSTSKTSFAFTTQSVHPPPDPALRQDAARAPPFYI